MTRRSIHPSKVSLFNPDTELRLPWDPIADAWYAADCPDDFDARKSLGTATWIAARAARFARRHLQVCGITTAHRWIPSHTNAATCWCRKCQATRKIGAKVVR